MLSRKYISLVNCTIFIQKIHNYAYFSDTLTQYGTATQSSIFSSGLGEPENAIYPPISNSFSVNRCSHTTLDVNTESAW